MLTLLNLGKTLYVSNLSKRVENRDLERKFKRYGDLVDSKIVMDPIMRESRGFGFVTFANKDHAAEAQKELDGYDMEGKNIIVQVAKRSKPRRPTPGKYLGFDKARRSNSRYV